MLVNQPLNFRDILTNRKRTDLLVIADYDGLLCHIESQEPHYVALTRLVNDNHVEPRHTRIKGFGNAR
jgi:hypothetical protein